MRSVQRFIALLAVAGLASSCSSTTKQGTGPMFLTLDTLTAAQGNKTTTLTSFLLSDVVTNITSPPPCTNDAPCPTIFNDVGSASFHAYLKDIGNPATPSTPTTNNQVTITRYHVSYVRADGRNTAGVDVPYPFDGAATGTIPVGGALTLGFEWVRHDAKEEAPLVQLRGTAQIITTIATVTFYGTDAVGNAISVSGSLQIDFGNFGDTSS